MAHFIWFCYRKGLILSKTFIWRKIVKLFIVIFYYVDEKNFALTKQPIFIFMENSDTISECACVSVCIQYTTGTAPVN